MKKVFVLASLLSIFISCNKEKDEVVPKEKVEVVKKEDSLSKKAETNDSTDNEKNSSDTNKSNNTKGDANSSNTGKNTTTKITKKPTSGNSSKVTKNSSSSSSSSSSTNGSFVNTGGAKNDANTQANLVLRSYNSSMHGAVVEIKSVKKWSQTEIDHLQELADSYDIKYMERLDKELESLNRTFQSQERVLKELDKNLKRHESYLEREYKKISLKDEALEKLELENANLDPSASNYSTEKGRIMNEIAILEMAIHNIEVRIKFGLMKKYQEVEKKFLDQQDKMYFGINQDLRNKKKELQDLKDQQTAFKALFKNGEQVAKDLLKRRNAQRYVQYVDESKKAYEDNPIKGTFKNGDLLVEIY
ncbi:hypothetical protein [Flammeovirga kamogawensis]|uniref:Lipoprotein n=1 Tax=Flammeovirga kamogawensis TaxID=373891 RepID=A0ABX8GV52_9BACT|nr:hypothetical protein [Flammeovirga kamogawensis]MBB6461615.1 putative coiled-coil protein SlyX [Flammeovirga kamogawensis]QWG07456.1 hypothetical protein KM029_00500 [Flammeovirga kamogawensis]TRX69268.1 hypothetical protein EO216_14445 [Flammeovirga kamogawensis]